MRRNANAIRKRTDHVATRACVVRSPIGHGVAALVAVAIACMATPASARTRDVDPRFAPILKRLTSLTSVPIRLPASIPTPPPHATTLYASIASDVTDANLYDVELDTTARCIGSHACNVADFVGERSSKDPAPLGTTTVSLANGVRGYFTPGRCGSSCGHSRLDWIVGRYRYAVFVRFEPTPVDSLKLARSMSGVTAISTVSNRSRPLRDARPRRALSRPA